ncbi:hypothetical protein [Candidatus Poriferisodalis sp.]|uniref:hypothetical protein n=1 Tax=Candidatus Poriferisodalis sp. TaxID=3101277 RepID=UPI003B5A9627
MSRLNQPASTAATFTTMNTAAAVTHLRSVLRCWAAKFLAPAASLRERIDDRFADQDLVTDLAEEFGVPSYAVEHQVENHGIAQLAACGLQNAPVSTEKARRGAPSGGLGSTQVQ